MADIITYPENGITYDADDASGYPVSYTHLTLPTT